MNPSSAAHEWLGRGIYFWQAAPIRAWMWKRFQAMPASKRSSASETVVLEYAMSLDLGSCLDLLDLRWYKVLRSIGLGVTDGWHSAGVSEADIKKRLKENARFSSPLRHFLDCSVINQVCDLLAHRDGIDIRVVRAAFQNEDRVYPHSAFREGDHVQVAVRDLSLIDVSKLREISSLESEESRFSPGFLRRM
jgi:hypothetical protein